MQKKLHILILTSLLLSLNTTYGNKTKLTAKSIHKNHPNLKDNLSNERAKRSLQDVEGTSWLSRGIVPHDLLNLNIPKNNKDHSFRHENFNAMFKNDQEPYFFDPSSIYDSSSAEIGDFGEIPSKNYHFLQKNKIEDQVYPFWANRGRRSSDEVEDAPFWGNRGRRQSEEEPFWGARGRRQEDDPFWGSRGRREEEPFWGSRGRREDEPFWGSRGRREVEPFWGSRGRRQDSEPFWGNRGRRQDSEPFWGSRGRRLESVMNSDAKEGIKKSIVDAIRNVENNIEELSQLKTDNIGDGHKLYFWKNRKRDSKLKHLFNKINRQNLQSSGHPLTGESSTVHDNRFFVDQPSYIVVERVSRSSDEDDPYFISRGKKKNTLDFLKQERDRRNAFEDLVKSVRNDPYYIARGKKKSNDNKNLNSSNELAKTRNLICSTIDLMTLNSGSPKVKRDVNENDRDRRTTLKKLQAQLQMDPYFVSRGKKSDNSEKNDENIEDFINQVTSMCNNL